LLTFKKGTAPGKYSSIEFQNFVDVSMWVEMIESVGVLAVLKDRRIFVVNVGNLDIPGDQKGLFKLAVQSYL
jgi:hypothetical protein